MSYRKAARQTTRRIRFRPIRVAGLPGATTAIAAALGYRSMTAPSSSTAPPSDAFRAKRPGVLDEGSPNTVWPTHGRAAFVQTGQSQMQAGLNQHAAEIASHAKVMTSTLATELTATHSPQAGRKHE